MPKAILNGKIIEEAEANISISDKGYFFDFAVYSSVKVIKGKIFFPEYHICRLFESAEHLGLTHGFREDEVASWAKTLVAEDGIEDALLRLVLIGDPDGKGGEKLFIFSVGGLTYYPDKFYKSGVKVITYDGERRIPKSKSKDLLISFLAFREAKKNEALDALLVDCDGNIREGTRSNFFAISGGALITPPDEKVLGGITKKIILEACKGRFKIRLEDIPLKDIRKYDELFISSTSMNVMPVRQIDDVVFETDFSKTRAVQKLYKGYCDKL